MDGVLSATQPRRFLMTPVNLRYAAVANVGAEKYPPGAAATAFMVWLFKLAVPLNLRVFRRLCSVFMGVMVTETRSPCFPTININWESH